MTPTAVALLGYCAWSLLLILLLVVVRSGIVMAGKKAANAFKPSGDDLEGFPQRATRAHANNYENLPLAAAVLLYAMATGQTALTDPLAYVFLGARILQSTTHLLSVSRPAVLVRFGLYLAQVAILAFWLLKLLTIA